MTKQELKQAIHNIISQIVCDRCGKFATALCNQHRARCYSEYDKEAEAIIKFLIEKGFVK